jgi:proline iminopeptidase
VSLRGANLYVDVAGQGEPLICLHGGPGLDHTYLRPYFQHLEATHQMIYYDQRCTGRSGGKPNKNEVTLHRFIADLEAIRKGLQLPQVTLVGHSWGALLALKYALAFPKQVRALLLISPLPLTGDELQTAIRRTLTSRSREEQDLLARTAASEGVLRGRTDAINAYLNLLFRPYFTGTAPTFQFEAQTAKNSLLVANLMFNDLGEYDFLDECKTIACPSLTIVGRKDIVSWEGAQHLHAALPQDTLSVIEDVGHFPFIEATEACLTAIYDF